MRKIMTKTMQSVIGLLVLSFMGQQAAYSLVEGTALEAMNKTPNVKFHGCQSAKKQVKKTETASPVVIRSMGAYDGQAIRELLETVRHLTRIQKRTDKRLDKILKELKSRPNVVPQQTEGAPSKRESGDRVDAAADK